MSILRTLDAEEREGHYFTLKRFFGIDHYLTNVVYLAFKMGDKYGE